MFGVLKLPNSHSPLIAPSPKSQKKRPDFSTQKFDIFPSYKNGLLHGLNLSVSDTKIKIYNHVPYS